MHNRQAQRWQLAAGEHCARVTQGKKGVWGQVEVGRSSWTARHGHVTAGPFHRTRTPAGVEWRVLIVCSVGSRRLLKAPDHSSVQTHSHRLKLDTRLHLLELLTVNCGGAGGSGAYCAGFRFRSAGVVCGWRRTGSVRWGPRGQARCEPVSQARRPLLLVGTLSCPGAPIRAVPTQLCEDSDRTHTWGRSAGRLGRGARRGRG